MSGDGLGAWIVAAIAMLAVGGLALSRIPARIKQLLIFGLLLRVFGSQMYYYLTQLVYGGSGDYNTYFQIGTEWARAWTEGTLSEFSSPYMRDEWCCTAYTIRITGLMTLVIGPTITGGFLLFALLAYAGIVAIIVGFQRSLPELAPDRYVAWMMLFPSLWFWPSALGKDAMILAGVGFAFLGFIGKNGRTGWVPLLFGLALVFPVRPQVAAVLIASMVLAYWLGREAKLTAARAVQGLVLVGGGFVVITLAGRAMGMDMFDPAQVESYMDDRGGSSSYGGSQIATGGPVRGIINVLFRPFLWESRSPMMLLAGLEIAALWALMIWRFAAVKAFFLRYRRTRVVAFAVVFVLSYSALTGMVMGNLGLIARQRIHVFPFLLMFLATAAFSSPPARVATSAAARVRARRTVPA